MQVNYPYKHGEDRSILAFCKTKEQVDEALVAGASLAGCSEIISGVKVNIRRPVRCVVFNMLALTSLLILQRGKITLPDFSFVIAHPEVMHELTVIRGLLRKKFPSLESGW